jgi:hypothetical protein
MATIQEILEMNQGGASQASSDVRFLIQSIRDKMQRAKEEDAIRAESWRSGGKAGLNSLKARRDFLLAKRGNPNLKFMDFMLDPKTSAKYMTQGTDAIVGGRSSAIGLKETFNPFSSEYARDLEYESLRNRANQAIPSAQADMLPDQDLSSMPEFGDYSNLSNPPSYVPPTPLGDVSGQGLQDMLARRQSNFINQSLGGVSPSSGAVSPSGLVPDFGASAISEGVLPQGVQRVAGNQASQNVIQQAMDEARLRLGAQKVSQAVPSQVPSETGASTGTMGTAGKALGALGGAYSLGTGLQDIAKGKGDLSTVAKTASGGAGILSALGMMNPMVGLGLGALSMLSRRR